MRESSSWTTPAFVLWRSRAAICRCISAMTGCTWTRFPAGPRGAGAYCAYLPISIPGRSLRAPAAQLLRAVRLPVAERSTYDEFMLRFHDWLKENSRFQSSAEKTRLAFPPLATWLVFTDGVPHAALSGQFALEQTFIIPPAALAAPDFAPIRILEKLCGRPLA